MDYLLEKQFTWHLIGDGVWCSSVLQKKVAQAMCQGE